MKNKKENNLRKMSSTSTQNDFEEKLKECENKPEELSKIFESQEIKIEKKKTETTIRTPKYND